MMDGGYTSTNPYGLPSIADYLTAPLPFGDQLLPPDDNESPAILCGG
jgi:hypothetical protein